MDLTDAPTSVPVVSEQIVVKPEYQGDLTRNNGSRNVKLNIPRDVGYWLPSQSNLVYNIKMQGRGNPIPSRDAGAHSLFGTIRSHDGTGSHLLEEVVQSNTLVAQLFNVTKNEASENNRAEFQGVQASDSASNNLYWSQAGGTNWSGGTIAEPSVGRSVQIVAPIQTKLYTCEDYIPCEALGGVRTELQLENYERALEYTTGSLGVKHGSVSPEGVMAYPLAIFQNASSQAATGGQAKMDMFTYTVPGAGYSQNHIYSFQIGGVDCGFIEVLNAGGTITEASIFSLGMSAGTASVRVPQAGDTLNVVDPGGGGSAPATLTLNAYANGSGDGSCSNSFQEIEVPLWADTPGNLKLRVETVAPAAGALVSPPGIETAFGQGTLRDPFRNVTPRASAAYDPTGCYPTTLMPFSIGDRVYMARSDDADEVSCGVLCGISEYLSTGAPKLHFKNDRPPLPALASGDAAAGKKATANKVWLNDYSFSHNDNGVKLYVADTDRLNGWTLSNLPNNSSTASLHSAAAQTVDYTLSDIQYQLQQVRLDDRVRAADLAAARSAKGLQIDLDTVQTRLVNQAAIQGPTSQLISNPNITRALSVLSVPLNQNNQRGLWANSLRGEPDNMTSYQFDLGKFGLVPARPVPVDKASLGNPLVQAWAINEKMKCMESFDLVVSNLNHINMNFSVGRQFSRRGMYFDLMKAGDLNLKCQYDEAQTSPKLFCHYVNHIRSINVSSAGIKIMN